ncbi:MAG: hypothetical protein FWC60_12405 [Firmicutes bacterium]|nr:hypothetical protein [Bacillota bacterium]
MLDAAAVFNANQADFSSEAGTPESSNVFHEEFINPAYERNRAEGLAMSAAYGSAIADYQRDGFIVGFNAAMQLVMGCMRGK